MNLGVGPREPDGFTLLELLVALLLSCALLALTLSTMARQRDLLRRMGERSERLAAMRVVRHVLGREARATSAEGAWSVGGDSLALRSFRGLALVCGGSAGQPELQVSAAGVRAPDPGKDSVLLLRTNGEVVALALLERYSPQGACPALIGGVQGWVLSGPAPRDAVAARWFERGSYHLSAKALRYRRGLGGRQPLTPEVLSTPPSGFAASGEGGGVDVLLEEEETHPPKAWLFRMGVPR